LPVVASVPQAIAMAVRAAALGLSAAIRSKATAKPRRARRVRTAGSVKICSTRLIGDAGHLGMHFIGREEAEPFALRFRLLE
jgi:hypothetical protein